MEGRLPMMKKNSQGSPTSPPSVSSPTHFRFDEKTLYRKSSVSSTHSRPHTRTSSISDEEALLKGPPQSPTKVPPLRAMRSSGAKKPPSQPSTPFVTSPQSRSGGGGSGDHGVTFQMPLFHTYSGHMIRGKWAMARLRTILFMFIAAAAATTFGLVYAVYKLDYLPYKNAESVPRSFNHGTWSAQNGQNNDAGRAGMKVRAYYPDMDMTGVYLIIAFCGVGTVVFFSLWLQNTYRSAKSYYIMFTRTEIFSLVMLIVFGIGFGATAGYVTYTFKLDNDYRDFWSYTCTRHGTAQAIVFKSKIYYDGNCHMLTGSWITLLTLCGFSLLTLLTFPANYFYHRKMKDVGYSRFENKIGLEAEIEDKEIRRQALRIREPWKMPRLPRFGKKKEEDD